MKDYHVICIDFITTESKLFQIEVTIKPSAESETKTATAQDPLPVIEPNIPTAAAHGVQNASGAASQGNTNAENDALANITDAAAQAPGAQV